MLRRLGEGVFTHSQDQDGMSAAYLPSANSNRRQFRGYNAYRNT
jgi:hypothetical protein